jgi:hypothetical protein
MKLRHYIGSAFDDFLAKEGILEECTQLAIEEISDWQASHKNKVLKISVRKKKFIKRVGKLFQSRDGYVYHRDQQQRHLKARKKSPHLADL